MTKLPNATDRDVGKRISVYRRGKKLTQPQLAERIGITYQQLQKYELGKNRITVGKLADIAAVLEVDMNVFFDHNRSGSASNDNTGVSSGFEITREALLMNNAFMSISRPSVRGRLLELVQAIAAEEAASAAPEIVPERAVPGGK